MNQQIVVAVRERFWITSMVACFTLIYSFTSTTCPGPQEAPALYPLMCGSVKGGDRKFGFVDATGSLIVPAQYEWAG